MSDQQKGPAGEISVEKQQVVQIAQQVVTVPDIGGAVEVDVIEVRVKVGQVLTIEQPLVTLEGDKATMEIPSPVAGTVQAVALKVGDKVKQGDAILTVSLAVASGQGAEEPQPASDAATAQTVPASASSDVLPVAGVSSGVSDTPLPPQSVSDTVSSSAPQPNACYAGPAARRLARELDLDLQAVPGTGQKGRIQKKDVQDYVKARMQSASMTGGGGFAPAPAIDFSQFGATEVQALNKIKRLTGQSVHRSWVSVPHVTQFEQVDITDLEAFRCQEKPQAKAQGFNLTLLPFVIKAVVRSLRAFPTFNASLHPDGQSLILKKYFHIGVAVDTPNGLVVPVLRDVDQKGVWDLAKELATISQKAREKGLSVKEMQGSCLTISSLGGIGGSAFTPIVNTPDVAILGLSKARYQPVYHADVAGMSCASGQAAGSGVTFVPRLMLPLSLSYDHRVIDGAEGARFIVHLATCLADMRRLMM